MKTDYLLMGVDGEAQVAIRFLSLSEVLNQSQDIHSQVDGPLLDVYFEFLLLSVLLGSRMDDQESILFKLKMKDPVLQINCEVNPKGLLRSAIFPKESFSFFNGQLDGVLQVVRLKKNSETYQSLTQVTTSSVVEVFKDYLKQSDQSESILLVHHNTQNTNKNFALWIEKLPQTPDLVWQTWEDRFSDQSLLSKIEPLSLDPDLLIQKLFPDTFRIMAVTHPQLSCTCSQEKITQALMVLPKEDLVELFVAQKGVEMSCDYCGKVWRTEDAVLKELLEAHKTVQ